MRLSIRLQNHGKKNHPYWWIVVAPQHKNIFGRYTEHIGFWSPRHNVNIKRQVILNIPRLMYWLGNGAIPTFKIQKFMHMFGIFPKPWQYIKSAEELAEEAKKEKPYQQMSAKQKSLKDRKRKRQERSELHYSNYHRYEAYAMRQNKIQQQLMGRQHANEFENQVIRDMLHEADFQKYDRLAELSGDNFEAKPHLQKLNQIRQKIRNCKSQLAMLQRHFVNQNVLRRSKLVQKINFLNAQLQKILNEPTHLRLPEDPTNQNEFMTTDYLQKKAKYELITKKFEKTQQQLQQFPKLFQPITISELAYKLKEEYEAKQKKEDEQDANQQSSRPVTIESFFQAAEDILVQRNRANTPILRHQLKDEFDNLDQDQENEEKDNFGNPQSHMSIINQILADELVPPSIRPVHPRPDLKTYIPEQHYDPIDKTKLDIMKMDALDPHEQIEKYKRKRKEGETIEERKSRDHRKRMQRLRLNTEE